ncbi:MAG: PAS domain S-box protein [Desulfobacula sp.]|uniref:PAS domain-containing protein n=1 Tax=Desulfobacula sp. TaxID=2593537 RepID=UPI001D5827AB|nr:PAS domain S-box protein [Desulfobacula sp.]
MVDKPSYEELEQRVQGLQKITNELRQAEKALLENEKKFRFLTENIADIVWTLDRNFKTTYVSPSIENMLGFTPKERKQQSLEEMITPDSLQKIQMKFLEELEHDEKNLSDPERFITMEVQYYRKDNSIVWMENSIKAIRDPAGKIVGMHGVSRDINKRKKAEEKLRDSETRFRILTEQSPNMVFINANGKIVYVNDRCLSSKLSPKLNLFFCSNFL